MLLQAKNGKKPFSGDNKLSKICMGLVNFSVVGEGGKYK